MAYPAAMRFDIGVALMRTSAYSRKILISIGGLNVPMALQFDYHHHYSFLIWPFWSLIWFALVAAPAEMIEIGLHVGILHNGRYQLLEHQGPKAQKQAQK
jgi:hypothetical protein